MVSAIRSPALFWLVSLLSTKCRRCRRELRMVTRKKSTTEKILLVLIESGMIYCISAVRLSRFILLYSTHQKFIRQLVAVVALTIRFPQGTLGDIYRPTHAQLSVSSCTQYFIAACDAGTQSLYPAVVLVLVNQQKSLEEYMPSETETRTRLSTLLSLRSLTETTHQPITPIQVHFMVCRFDALLLATINCCISGRWLGALLNIR